MMKNKKGGAMIVIALIVGLFIASLLFITFLPVVAEVISIAENETAVAASSEAMLTIRRIASTWYALPVFVIIVIGIWAIAASLRKETTDNEF